MLIVSFVAAILIGVILGIALAATRNMALTEQFADAPPALPTRILDIKGREITEFFGDQKREPVTIDQIPQYLIDAVITREDRTFYSHHGFSLSGMARAFYFIATGQYVSGASTITQQLAGALKGIRKDFSLKRKLTELWLAVQMERRYTKQEILEMYLNYMDFGYGNQGVQAASKYFFRHDVWNDTLAEAVMLVVQLSSPNNNSPIRNPDRAKILQRDTLNNMVRLGYVTKKAADDSFDEYWRTYDYSRSNASAFLDRSATDKAPYFSEYIRTQLDDILVGSYNMYTDGLVVHTTLNLDYQAEAEKLMAEGIDDVNAQYLATSGAKIASSTTTLMPLLDMLGFTFNIDDLLTRNRNAAGNAKRQYAQKIAPVVEILTSLFPLPDTQKIVSAGSSSLLALTRKTQVQGALVSIDPSNGNILAMVGGRRFYAGDRFNRATLARVPPGSSFKPLYYSAAIDSRKFTAASMILDSPVVFQNPDGTIYEPYNFKGEWHGRVLLRNALAESMNVPSLKILDGIGFDAAIQRTSRMLGITDPAELETRHFDRVYPLGLGVVAVSPLEMARAYSVFANGGREVVPVSILYIEDRNGKTIFEPAKKVMQEESAKGSGAQIMSAQTAYIMTSILQSTIKEGTLGGVGSLLDIWNDASQPFAAKTGTSENWGDAWTVGFSPYVATAVWYGFDQGSRSLGVTLTGATIAGPTWAQYMKAIHKDLPPRKFVRPEGLVDRIVSATSGLLPTPYTKKTITEIFLPGTEPKTFDEIDEYDATQAQSTVQNLTDSLMNNPGLQGTPDIPLPQPGGTEASPSGNDTGTSTGGNPYLN